MKQEATHAPVAFRRLGIALLMTFIASLLVVLWLNLHARAQWRTDADLRQRAIERGPRVFVVKAERTPGERILTLPADVRAFTQVTLYGKIAGYVKALEVEIGDHVRKGQVLGVLESPEVDQQVAAAVSDETIKRRTYERYAELVEKDYVSKQDYEVAKAAYGVAQATLRQARAMQEYKIIRAPFDGTITNRYVDRGALLPAATGSTTSAQPLVDVADVSKLRISLFLQQDAAPYVRVGDEVTMTSMHQPDLSIEAKVSRFTMALDRRTRSMLCEIWVENHYRLYPGAFVHVSLHLKTPELPVVPASALLLRHDKTALAVVRDNHVHFVNVQSGVNDGTTVQIVSGIRVGEWVAVNLPTEVREGDLVRPVNERFDRATSGSAPGEAGSGATGSGETGGASQPAGESR